MADKFGGQKDGRQSTGATFYDVPAVPVNANALYFPNFPASPFFGVAEYPVAAGDLGAFSTSGVFVFDKPTGWIDNPGRKVFYRPKTAATGEIVAQEVKGDVFVGYQVIDNINPQKLGVLLASPEFCMNVLMVTSTADSGAGSLRQAIAGASDGDVILFDADVFPQGQTTSILLSSYITVNKLISIYGGDGDGQGGYTSGATKRYYVYREIEGVKTKVYIDENNPALDDETVLFENVCRVSLDGQNAVRFIYQNSKTSIFVGLGFANGHASVAGGCYIYNTATATFNDCDFNNIDSSGNGGVFYTGNTAQIVLNTCSFISCDSGGNGGVIFTDGASKFNITDCVFDSCTATNGGGVCSTSTSQNTLNNCTITDCSANYGGGVYSANSSQNTLTDCNISNCSATNGGGLYSNSTSQNTLTDCTITNCSATNNGGGLFSNNTSQNTLNGCIITNCSATNGGAAYSDSDSTNTLINCTLNNNASSTLGRHGFVIGQTSVLTATSCNFDAVYMGARSTLNIDGITLINAITKTTATITIANGAALTITNRATIGAATFTSAGRGYLATAAGIDISSATLTNVVACSYGAGLESFEISEDGATWTAQDLTTPILIETRDAGGDWQTLTDSATGGEYATTFALESTARAFDGVAFFVATLQGYWQAGDAGAVDANDWSVRGFAAANSNGGGDAQGDAAQGWTVTPSTVTPNADGV